MKNLPIVPPLPSATPKQTQVLPENSSTDSFDSILARQLDHEAAHNKVGLDNKQMSPSTGADKSSAPAADDESDGVQLSNLLLYGSNNTGATPAELITSSLPAISSNAEKNAATPAQPIPDNINAIPAAMLAILMPTGENAKLAGTPAAEIASSTSPVMLMTQSRHLSASHSSAPIDTNQQLQQDATAVAILDKNQMAVLPSSPDNTNKPDNEFPIILDTLNKHTVTLPPSNNTELLSVVQPDTSTLSGTILQGGTISPSTNPGTTLQLAVNTPLTHNKWGDEFNQRITWMATQNGQSAELHLNPPQLGPLDVVLSVSGDQATALFTSPHASVRDAIEQALPKLREMMADNGIMLGNATVSGQAPREQQAGWANHKQAGNGGNEALPTPADITHSGHSSLVRRHQGMLDTFA